MTGRTGMMGEADAQGTGRATIRWRQRLDNLLRQVFPLHGRSPAARESIGFGAPPSQSLGHSVATTLPALCNLDRLRIEETVFLVIGTPDDREGFTTAIRAFALAARRGDRLVIVGCGRCRARLEKWIAALSIGDKIRFVDATASPDHAADIARHDVAIIVSAGPEAAGLFHCALHAKRPVLASDRSAAVATLVSNLNAGTVFCSGDVVALTQAMLRARLRVPHPPELEAPCAADARLERFKS